ncbi:MAG: hypothetical protein K0Q81_665 [Paenibacillus sp.]|jgi:hypothetical protein|nr:hypothetical protein [Paenibacillus sp.]
MIEVENNVVNERLHPIRYITPVSYKPECDCGSWAKLKINGQYRCWECAECEGVERV